LAGIYIHIPFCKQACNYCNFHFSTSLKLKNEFIGALVKEITLTAPLLKNEELSLEKEIISTLYFGGGTPSILDTGDLTIIFDALRSRFVFADDIEITLEANPDDITELKLQEWKQMGINRLSVGIQSFLEEELIWMNRAHNAAESLICIDHIKAAGFTNYSVDLIYGSPLLSDHDWKKNVQTVIEKDIPHISCYALTVEPKTALDKMIALKKKAPVDAERQAQQFLLLMEWIMTALRTMEGISINYITTKFGEEKSNQLQALSNKYESTGKLKIENGKIILTAEGKLFADGIAADLFFAPNP